MSEKEYTSYEAKGSVRNCHYFSKVSNHKKCSVCSTTVRIAKPKESVISFSSIFSDFYDKG